MLTNHELVDMCNRHRVPLVGVFSKDKLPPRRVEGGYIINLQNDKDEEGNDLDGTHWTAFFIKGKKACYFDSFGFVPPKSVQSFLAPFKPYAYSERDVQNINSGVCGWYCFCFLFAMSHWRGSSSLENKYNRFISLFSSDPTDNRRILERLLRGI